MNNITIPLTDVKSSYLSLQSEIDREMKKVLESGKYSKGHFLEVFENKFAEYLGVKHCIGVASGTDALYLSLLALGINSGDEVLVPANTFVATAYAVLFANAKPVLVDCNLESSNIDTSAIEKKITKKTKAIIPVHLYGQPVEMSQLKKIANKYSLKILEDACQSHGAYYKDKKTGNLGDIAAFSFYVTKNLGAFGDAGAITTNSTSLAKKLKQLREYGEVSRYIYNTIGINSRLDSLQASILTVKLRHLDQWNKKRKKIAAYYTDRLQNLSDVITPITIPNVEHVYHLYVIRTKKRNQLMKYLAQKGIQAAIHYPIPLHLQKSLQFLGYKKGDFPHTEQLADEILSLPIYPQLSSEQQDFIISNIEFFFNK